MKTARQLPAPPKNLRDRAEQRLATTRHDVAQMPVEDVQKLVHELQVHQIELEMQNDELRRVQHELETTSERYASLYDFAPVALLTLNAPGEILEANLGASELLGRSREKLLREKFTRFLPPEMQDAFYLFSRQVFGADGRQSVELNLVNAQAKRMVVQVDAVREADGFRKQARFSFTDITARQQTETALRRSEERYRTLIEQSPDGLFVTDSQANGFVFLELNTAASRMLGFTREELLGRSLLDMLMPGELPRIAAEVQTLQSGATVVSEWRARRKDGSVFPAEVCAHAIPDGRFQAVVRDITERKHAEIALREKTEALTLAHAQLSSSEQKLRGLFELSPLGIALNDMQGRFIDFNEAFRSLCGYPSEELKQLDYWKLTPKIYEPEELRQLESLRTTGRYGPYEKHYRRRDGKLVPISLNGMLITDDTGRSMIWSIVEDISERKQAEDRLVQLNRAKALLAGVDHAIVHLADRRKLLDEICRVAVDKGGFKLAWIGLTSPDGAVEPVAKAGAVRYLKNIQVTTRDEPTGRGAVGTAIRENRVVVIEDTVLDARTAPWRERLIQFGLRYLAVFPIRIAGRVAGAFSVYATHAKSFDEDELGLLAQVRDDISFALTTLEGAAAREQAETALRRSEHNLVNFFNKAPIGLLWLTAGGTILRANLAQLDLLGYAPEEYVGHSFLEFCGDPAQGRELLERLAAKETVSNMPMTRRHRDGSFRQVLVDANSFWSDAWGENQFLYSSIFMRDVTDRVKLEQEIMQAGEREQQRIARDLHDGLGQLLAGTAYLTSTLQTNLAAKARAESRQAGRILAVIHDAIEQTRNLARGLHPVEPEPQGLMSALEALATRTKKLFKVRCQFTCRRPVWVTDNAVATHLFRIAQEAITNAIKHGRASGIEIGLTATPSRISLMVQDNGSGLPARPEKKSGMGLRIMRYRAGVIGGSLALQKEPKGGTTVVCTVHLPGPANPLPAETPAEKFKS